MKVSDILRVKGNTLFTVSPDQPLHEAVVTMAEHDIGSLVVMDHGDLTDVRRIRRPRRLWGPSQLATQLPGPVQGERVEDVVAGIAVDQLAFLRAKGGVRAVLDRPAQGSVPPGFGLGFGLGEGEPLPPPPQP